MKNLISNGNIVKLCRTVDMSETKLEKIVKNYILPTKNQSVEQKRNSVIIPYYPHLGNGYTLEKKYIFKEGFDKPISSLELLWEKWLRSIPSETTIVVKSIVGEFSNLSYIESALKLENCMSVEVIFGDKLANDVNKQRLKFLLTKYSNKLKLYSRNSRPVRHKTRIHDKIFYEDLHKKGDDFQAAMVYENIPSEHQNEFDNTFDQLKDVNNGTVKEINSFNIDGVPIY